MGTVRIRRGHWYQTTSLGVSFANTIRINKLTLVDLLDLREDLVLSEGNLVLDVQL